VPTPDEILDDHVRPVRELAARLRGLILEAVPEAEEAARPGWHAITYRHPEAGYFAGIFPEADRVVIVFEHGHAVSDPSGLLETGTRKRSGP
jgi:hypothetical protein